MDEIKEKILEKALSISWYMVLDAIPDTVDNHSIRSRLEDLRDLVEENRR